MTGRESHPAQYFDGASAASQAITIHIGDDRLTLHIGAQQDIWPFKNIKVTSQNTKGARLSCSRRPDAMLVLTEESTVGALTAAAPFLFDGKRERRRMAKLIASLVAGAALIGGGLFFGVPAASGPLAQATPKDFEIRMGDNLSAQIMAVYRPCTNAEAAISILQPHLDALAEAGDVGFPIEFQFVRMRAPNAFALPGGHVMATRGLLEVLEDDPEAFMAVMAHELGHVKARDGMKAFYRNIGLGALLEIITGGSGVAQQAVMIGGQLQQMRYSRAQEARADETAAEIMLAAGLDPEALARAFDALQGYAGDKDLKFPGWLSSHPDTDDRIKKARKKKQAPARQPITDEDWAIIITACDKPES